ncbi:adipocyte plasma membrane-associated protein-like [Copidosoma floridanum]|uniref:adipocyte plasma membrane-associated protein-like n=1 Tax=Copidosoma floridanum TaxID=29053 RepID=UPI0006C9D6ED|nr:adipocyte plasma membrane-associated protein-like [Copidosoma floridanum]
MGYLKSVGTSIIWIYTALVVITFWPGLRPYGDFKEHEYIEPKALSGNLGINQRLDGVEKLFEGRVRGPEAFALHKGEVYASLLTGEIVKITKDKKLETVFKISEHDPETKTYRNGRPLGLQFDKAGFLYAADLFFGIFKIDLTTKNAELIVDTRNSNIEGKRAVANDLAIASNGDIYWSDSCAGFEFDGTFVPIVLLNPRGRLIRYSPETGRNEVLVRNLGVANGVALAKDESFVLVAECQLARIVKYHLKGAKAGRHEVFAEALPGFPDNITPDGGEGFLVALPMYTDAVNWSYLTLLGRHFYVRKCLVRLIYVLRAPFEYFHMLYPAYDPAPMVQAVNGFFNGFMVGETAAVLRLDANGKVTDAAYDTSGRMPGLSAAHVFGNELWLGSYMAQHIGKIPLKQALPTLGR